jgi:eukaryotic-like serine/threonine-protein kinase
VLLTFDDFVFDEDQRELRKANSPVKIDAKQFDLLAYFLKHPGELVTNRELLERIWAGRVMGDSVLSVSVAKLRKVLGHQKGQTEYIDNVRGHGCRFLRSVTIAESNVTRPVSTTMPLPGIETGMPPLIGRDSVMRRLEAAFARARAGKGRICALVGEPGIGKTRLAEALEERTAASGTRWAWARCQMIESDPPLWIWTKILREYLNTPLADEIRQILNDRLHELAYLAREGNLSAEWRESAAAIGHRTFDRIVDILRRLSLQQPLVLVLDDLQWADAASLSMLGYLLVEIGRWPILVVATARNTELGSKNSRDEHLRYILGHSRCERITLHRLSESDVAEYVAALFGEPDTELSRTVFERSEGNPFFMVELLRPWIDYRRPAPHELELSNLALDIVYQRIRKLDSETRRVVSAAAVIGRNFNLDILSCVMQREADSLLEQLDEPLANGIIIPSSEEPEQFAFSHELIREVLYQALSAAERGVWHRRAGEELEKRRALGQEVANAELAHHFLSALPNGEVTQAINYARSAATTAARFLAYSDACVLLKRSLRALQSTDHPDDYLQCCLLFELSLVERALGDSANFDHMRQAVTLARENRFGRLLAMVGRLLSNDPGSLLGFPGVTRVLETADEVLPKEDKKTRAIVLAHLTWTSPYGMSSQRVNELLDRAEELARESNSLSARSAVLRAKFFLNGVPATYDKAQSIADELKQLLRPHPEFWMVPSLEIQVFRIITSMQRGDQEAIQRAIDDFGAMARQIKSVELDWHHQRIAAIQRMNAGELTAVRKTLSDLRERGERLQLPGWRTICDLDLGVLLTQTTDIRHFAADFRRNLEIDESDSHGLRALKIQNMVELGLIDDAEKALRHFPLECLLDLPTNRDYLVVLTRLSVVSVAAGAVEYIDALYGLLKPYVQYYAVGISFHCEGSIGYYLGILARKLARNEEAIANLELALDHNSRAGLQAHVVRTRYELARALIDASNQGAHKRARSLLIQAREAAQRLDLQPLLSAIDQLLTVER